MRSRRHNSTLLYYDVSIERIVSQGETSSWYEQEEDEWIVLVEGEATLEIVQKSPDQVRTETLKRGDTCLLTAGTKHRVTKTSVKPPCVWICVFLKRK